VIRLKYNLEYVKYGFLQGDGCLGRLKSAEHLGLEINIGKDDGDIFKLFGITKEENKRSYYMVGFNDKLRYLEFSSEQLPSRVLPLTINNWTSDEQVSFLRGLYSANGSVIKTKCARITLKSTCKQLIEEVKLLLIGFE